MHGARHPDLDGEERPKKSLRPCFSAIHHVGTHSGPFRPGSGCSHPVTVSGQSAPVFGQCSIKRRTKEGPCWCDSPRYFVTASRRVLPGSARFFRVLPGWVLGFAGFYRALGSLVRRVLPRLRSKSRSRLLGLARASRHHVVGDDAAGDLRTRCRRASPPGHHRTVHDSIRGAIAIERSRAPDPDPASRIPHSGCRRWLTSS